VPLSQLLERRDRGDFVSSPLMVILQIEQSLSNVGDLLSLSSRNTFYDNMIFVGVHASQFILSCTSFGRHSSFVCVIHRTNECTSYSIFK
jgi:hypothetical protein